MDNPVICSLILPPPMYSSYGLVYFEQTSKIIFLPWIADIGVDSQCLPATGILFTQQADFLIGGAATVSFNTPVSHKNAIFLLRDVSP